MSKISKSEIDKAIELFNSGISITKIAKQLNRDRGTLTKRLKDAGVSIIQDNNKKYVNSNYFSEINEHSAYWLGLLMADGHVDLNNNSLELTLKDKEHIEKFKQDLSSDHTIGTKTINGHIYYRLCFRDKTIINDLANYGFHNTKTYNWNMPDIPNEFMKDFIRGLYDGDGCFRLKINKDIYVGESNCSIVSYNKDILEQIKIIICSETNINPKHISIYDYENRIPELNIHSKDAIQQFTDWIYNDATIYLNRKYQKYLDFCRLRTISEEE